MADTELSEAAEFLRRFFSGTVRQRSRLAAKAPLPAIQAAALRDPDPFARRAYLFFLDHYANDESMAVFGAALGDPVDFVRNAALHSLACESCKAGPMCAADVVPGLVATLEHDPSAELRTKTIPILFRLSGRASDAWVAIERASHEDPDGLVRQAASDALAGRFVAPRKRYERSQRRHARFAAR